MIQDDYQCHPKAIRGREARKVLRKALFRRTMGKSSLWNNTKPSLKKEAQGHEILG